MCSWNPDLEVEGGPRSPAVPELGPEPLQKSAGGNGFWILLILEWQWCCTGTYVWGFREMNASDFWQDNLKGKKVQWFLTLIIGITWCQFTYDIHFINYFIAKILINIPHPWENNSWSFWSRILRTYQWGGQVSTKKLS